MSDESTGSRPPPPSYPPPPPPPSSSSSSKNSDCDNASSAAADNKNNDTETQFVTHILMTDALQRTGYYTGPIHKETGLSHGPGGVMLYLNNTRRKHRILKYTGDWQQGHWHGQCTNCTTVGGDCIVDASVERSQFVSAKLQRSSTHSQYTGALDSNAQPHGAGGRMVWHSSEGKGQNVICYYEGDFWHNQRHGKGKFQDLIHGVKYEGAWHKGLYQGEGVYQWKDSDKSTTNSWHVYDGEFYQGKPHGKGTQTRPDGSIRHKGMWKNGEPVPENKTAPPTNGRRSTQHKRRDHVTVVEQRTWSDTSSQQQGIYRGLWNTATNCPHGNGTVEYCNGDEEDSSRKGTSYRKYDGCFENGQFHGHGRLVFQNGDVYEGDFLQHKRHGQGSYTWQDGRHYQGEFVENIREGSGTFTYSSNTMYEGEFHEGKRHGQGRFLFSDGSLYEGEWQCGAYHGQGTMVHPNGRTYAGEFQNGVEHGEGMELDATGSVVYQGEWIRGKPAGQQKVDETSPSVVDEFVATEDDAQTDDAGGPPWERCLGDVMIAPPDVGILSEEDVYIVDDDDQYDDTFHERLARHDCEAVVDHTITDGQGNRGQYTGLVRKDNHQPNGVGRLVYEDGKRIHEGFWVNGQKEGHGRCLFFPQGDFHEGNYRNNLRCGPGVYQWQDGRKFEGEYENDVRHGKGVFSYPTGERYEGSFEDGRRSGKGIFTFDHGRGRYDGSWKAGKYHGTGTLLWGDGFSYTGSFFNGAFHGKGVKKGPDGVFEGNWINGELEEEQPEAGAKSSSPTDELTIAAAKVDSPISHCMT